MIEFKEFELSNGLRVLLHTDKSTPIVAINTLYNVGARDELEDKTGFAHLFEHLMFGGSENIESFDQPLQMVGGENNAFTSNDITNYYITLPKDSIETALWLESDRMLNLAFSEESLRVQKNIVIEEFNQRYLNQPYGKANLELRPLAFKTHPYKWATIGKDVSHIENANMRDVKDFFNRFYNPNNAILSVAGNIELEELKPLVKKWFGDIPKGSKNINSYKKEVEQLAQNRAITYDNVPQDSIYMAFHMVGRSHSDYHVFDLLSDILSRGSSSRLYQNLVKEKTIFTEISAYVTGEHDPGLFIISGKVNPRYTIDEAENAIWEQINLLKSETVNTVELEKVKNKITVSLEFANNSVLNKAMGLATAKLLGDPNLVNIELTQYQNVLLEDIHRITNGYLTEENSSVLHYLRENDK